MATFLFDEIIFGPVTSRRLGNSLGINLLPTNRKVCNFNCIYCECGLTSTTKSSKNYRLPERQHVKGELEKKLLDFRHSNTRIDTITFAGNGEPTMHPDFPLIIEDTIKLRGQYFPETKIAVLSNATLIGKAAIKNALMKVEYCILKLDSAIEDTIRILNCPLGNFSLNKLIHDLSLFRNNLTIQTLFIRGEYNGKFVDNSSEVEIVKWLDLMKKLKPQLVMVYTFARETPITSLEKIDFAKLNEIAKRLESLGIPAIVSS